MRRQFLDRFGLAQGAAESESFLAGQLLFACGGQQEHGDAALRVVELLDVGLELRAQAAAPGRTCGGQLVNEVSKSGGWHLGREPARSSREAVPPMAI